MKKPHFNTGRKRPDLMAGAELANVNLNIRIPAELRDKANALAKRSQVPLTQIIIAHLRAITEGN